jgi:hypothetical protein
MDSVALRSLALRNKFDVKSQAQYIPKEWTQTGTAAGGSGTGATHVISHDGPPGSHPSDFVFAQFAVDCVSSCIKQGMVTFEQARDGFTYEVQLPDGTTRDERFAGIPGLTKQSIEWRGYLSLRETVNDVELQLLRARYQSLFEDQQIAFKQFDELVENKRLTGAERDLLRRIIKTYNDLYTADITFDERGYPKLNAEAMENGNDFVVAINKALTLGQDRDFNEVARFFEGRMADDMVAKLREFRTRLKIGADNKFTIQCFRKMVSNKNQL